MSVLFICLKKYLTDKLGIGESIMVKHTRNIRMRLIYFILLFIVYRQSFVIQKLSLNLAMYGLFIILFFSYYLFNTINFDSRYQRVNIIYSTILNFFTFMIFYFFYKEETLIFAFLTYTVIQTTLNYLLYKKEEKKSRVLILDNENSYVEIIEDSLELRDNKYRYCGYLANDVVDGKYYLGRLDEIKEIVEKEKIEIIIFVKDKVLKEYSDLILEVKLRGVRVVDYLTFLENIEGKIDVEKIDSMWVLMSNGFDTLSNDFEKKLKRLFDVVLSFILFICFIPFMAVTYVMVKLDVGVKYLFTNPRKIWENPAFFKQKRIGFRGKEFEIIKFRSMKVHDPNKYSKYASEHDDRITKMGHFIRKTRLDELPQVINVLRGDMSFVGPRPEWDILGRDYEKKIKNYHLRYAVQPGITGWAQTMFTYGASVDDAKIKLEYDLYYVKNNSLVLDMIILFKTSKIVLFGKGM